MQPVEDQCGHERIGIIEFPPTPTPVAVLHLGQAGQSIGGNRRDLRAEVWSRQSQLAKRLVKREVALADEWPGAQLGLPSRPCVPVLNNISTGSETARRE